MCSFASALQWQIISNLTPYVTSEFSSHSLIPTIGIVASILSGVLKLPISKVIDAWGRPQGLAAVVVLATIGLILMAACTNIKTYAAAQVCLCTVPCMQMHCYCNCSKLCEIMVLLVVVMVQGN